MPLGSGLCGPPWDPDGDTIYTATETNPTNRVSNGGFYAFDTLVFDRNLSEARGIATFGSLYRGMNLVDADTGYTHYDFCDGVDQDDWGTGHLVRLIQAAGRRWSRVKLGREPLLQVGDLSLREGGYFPGQPGIPGCEQGHAYHQQGLDVDVRYLRKDGLEGPLNICRDPANYDTVATAQLMNSFLFVEAAEANAQIDSIFVDLNCVGLRHTTDTGRRVLFHKDGHENHFHVRIVDPDGPFN